ncbi:MAG: hypothetical protein KatS3mg058_0425 [Roseiflexus sp.]|nr:MAG: hypothetical protein KatS3mg058_0425 [Roseiflexus sp.]
MIRACGARRSTGSGRAGGCCAPPASLLSLPSAPHIIVNIMPPPLSFGQSSALTAHATVSMPQRQYRSPTLAPGDQRTATADAALADSPTFQQVARRSRSGRLPAGSSALAQTRSSAPATVPASQSRSPLAERRLAQRRREGVAAQRQARLRRTAQPGRQRKSISSLLVGGGRVERRFHLPIFHLHHPTCLDPA